MCKIGGIRQGNYSASGYPPLLRPLVSHNPRSATVPDYPSFANIICMSRPVLSDAAAGAIVHAGYRTAFTRLHRRRHCRRRILLAVNVHENWPTASVACVSH